MRSRMSPEQRARLRELFNTDMNVRTELAHVPVGEEPLRGLPSFELELGPDGRAYAVEPGVKFDPPKLREPVLEKPPPEPVEEELERVAVEERPPPPEMEEEEPPATLEPELELTLREEEPPEPLRQRFAEAYRAVAEPPPAPGEHTDTMAI